MNRDTRLAVLERDNYSCRRCGVHMSVRGYSIHHRKGRHCTESDSLANLVTLCGSGTTGCHLWAHANPADAYATGWLVRRLTAEDPEDVPLTDVRGHPVRPHRGRGRHPLRRHSTGGR